MREVVAEEDITILVLLQEVLVEVEMLGLLLLLILAVVVAHQKLVVLFLVFQNLEIAKPMPLVSHPLVLELQVLVLQVFYLLHLSYQNHPN